MYGCEIWSIKKAEVQRIDTIELWYWRRLLRVTWTARRSNQQGNQPWIFIGRTDAEVEAPILWPPDAKIWLFRKDRDAGKNWWQEKGVTENEMVAWHHRLYRHEFEQALGVDDGQGSLACYNPWGHKELGTTEWLNWTDSWFIMLYSKVIQFSTYLYVLFKKYYFLLWFIIGYWM